MVRKQKCSECRNQKQKCSPEGRTWNPDLNVTEKCDKCKKGNRPCGPDESPPDQLHRSRTVRGQKGSDGGGIAPSVDADTSDTDCARPANVFGGNVTEHVAELRRKLRHLDADVMLANRVQAVITAMENRTIHGHKSLICVPEYYRLNELRHLTSESLLTRLNEVNALGEWADSAGELELAEITYTRMLEIYRQQPVPVTSFIRHVLMKMVSLYHKTDQPLRAEKCQLEIINLRQFSGVPSHNEQRIWESFVSSLPQTSTIISNAIRVHQPDFFAPLNLETPFPPLHEMIKNDSICNSYSKDSCHESASDRPASPSIHAAMNGGFEIIGKFFDGSIGARDILSRTPLFLAAFLGKEDVGYAIMARIATLTSPLQKSHMNERDLSGQSILGIATLSGCSHEFIKTLTIRGAKIDPDVLLKDPVTPLQAACITQRPDIVKLFLDGGADRDRVVPGNPLPLEIAQGLQNQDIIRLLTDVPPNGMTTSNTFQGIDNASAIRSLSDLRPDYLAGFQPDHELAFVDDPREE